MNIRWNQIAITAAAGFLLGAFFSDFYHMHLKRRPPQQSRPAAAEGPIERFTHELDLSAPQQEKVSGIFNKYRPEVKKAKTKLEELRLSIMSELKTVLTSEQYAKFEELDKNPGPAGGQPPRDREPPAAEN